MARADDRSFLQIKDALWWVDKRVNLIGAITAYGTRRRSKGTDCFCSLKIVDESCPDPGITVTIFAEDMGMLPDIVSMGDIIVLARVVMTNHCTEVYALYNKRFSAFALFEGKNGTGLNPYQVSPKFHLTKWDLECFVTEMRNWLNVFQLGTGLKECFLLEEIQEGGQFDLVCRFSNTNLLIALAFNARYNQILHVSQIKENEWMLFIWDGSDAPIVSIKEKLEDEAENALPLHVEPVPLERDTLSAFPVIGTVLRVAIAKSWQKLDIDSIKIGNWARLSRISCKLRSGLWCGVFTTFTNIQYLSVEDPLIMQRQSSYDERATTKWKRMPRSAFPWPSCATVTDHGHASFVTLMDILTYSKVTAKFRSVVRVVAVYPPDPKDFRFPSGVYRLRLTLEDPTARIHAFVCAEDGDTFFDGAPPVDVLRQKMNILLGVSSEQCDAPRNPPWVACCLKSYYLVKDNPWETRTFRIFDTKVVS